MTIPIYKGGAKTPEELPELLKGKYIIKFKIPSPFENLELNKTLTLPGGKKFLIEKISKSIDGKAELYISIFENPVPVILIITAIASIGLGFLTWKIIEEIRKVIDIPFEKSKNLLPIGILALLGLAIWKFT
jgi:hypothetical protein